MPSSNGPVLCPRVLVGNFLLTPLSVVRQDDVASFLGSSPGAYIANAPEPSWYRHIRLPPKQSIGSLARKQAVFRQMAQGSLWLSATYDHHCEASTRGFISGKIMHLGNGGLRGRWAQLWLSAELLKVLIQRRQAFSYCLVYNFDFPQFVVPLVMRSFFNKRLLVDFEDDYTKIRAPGVKNMLELWARRWVDGAVCINAAMQEAFGNVDTCVVNSFADLSYLATAQVNWRNGMRFVYAGRLDDVGGIGCLPDLVKSLRQHLTSFRIDVVGGGPWECRVRTWSLPEVHVHGYVNDAKLQSLLQRADAGLVLQSPGSPFARGSFPSKIDTYAATRTPILMLAAREV